MIRNAEWKRCRLNLDYHVEIAKHYYSVPHNLLHQKVEAHITQNRLTAWVKEVMEQAHKLPPGPDRDALIKKARQAHVAANLEDWANSPGLQSPK